MTFLAAALPDPSALRGVLPPGVITSNVTQVFPVSPTDAESVISSLSETAQPADADALLNPKTHDELVQAVFGASQAEIADQLCKAQQERETAEAAEASSFLNGALGTLGIAPDQTASDVFTGTASSILGIDVSKVGTDEGIWTQISNQFSQEFGRFADPFSEWVPDQNMTANGNAATALAGPLTNRAVLPNQSECDLSLLGGTVQTLGATATLGYRDLVVGLRNATLGVVQGVRTVANMAGALANLSVTEMLTRVATRALVLRSAQVKLGTVKRLAQQLDLLGRDAYGNNVDTLTQAKELLEISESNVTGLENIALRGGEVNATALNNEEERIEQAADLVVPLRNDLLPSVKGISLRARLLLEKTLLQSLTNDIQQTHNALALVYQNLANFSANLSAVTGQKSPNLVAPVLRQIRCRLEKVTDDMDRTLNSGNVLGTYIKRIQWFAELEALLLVVRTSKQLLASNPNPSLAITTTVSNALAGLQGELAEIADTGLSEQKVGQLLVLLVTIDRVLAARLLRYSPGDSLIALCDTGIALVDQIIAGSDGLTTEVDSIWSKNASVQTDLAAATIAVGNFIAFADKSRLNNVVDSFKTGGWAGLFGMTPEASSRAYHGETLTARLMEECRRDPQSTPRTLEDLAKLRLFFTTKRDEEEIERIYIGKQADKLKKEIDAIDIADPRSLLPTLRRLQRDPCVGAAALGSPLPQTIPTKCRPSLPVAPNTSVGLTSSELSNLAAGN